MYFNIVYKKIARALCLHLDPLKIVIVLQVDSIPTKVRYVDENGLYYN